LATLSSLPLASSVSQISVTTALSSSWSTVPLPSRSNFLNAFLRSKFLSWFAISLIFSSASYATLLLEAALSEASWFAEYLRAERGD
jgi:hypothetical protein